MEEDTPAELAAECAAGSLEEQLMQDLACQSFLHQERLRQERQTLMFGAVISSSLRAPTDDACCTHPTRRSCVR